ncbi:MAG: DNA-formamidopyrimidine glycosylase family protein [Micromonosporaceae bacterium]|jgi:formamidopyrimidine-DNA glycosylase
MPELPDVEGFRTVVAEHGTGRRVRRVDVIDAGVLHGVQPRELDRALSGRRLREPDRHGKWLLARTDGPTVMLHFGMTGDLRWSPGGEPRHRHDRVVFVTDDGELRYRDMRKLQGLRLAPDEHAVAETLAELGPDASTVSRRQLDAMLDGRRGAVKALLMDQSVIAGLGNLLSDEILWRAGIHPRTPCRDLTPHQRDRLHRALRGVLRASMPAGRIPPRPSWLTGVRDDPRAACPRCGTPLRRDRAAGRTTVWCPRCQPE